jgi:YopX protein
LIVEKWYICAMLNIELKFRGFNKKTKKLYRSGALSFSTERHSFMMYSDKDMDGVKDDDMEIMQFTGQKDINNKEIFQRDIVLIDEAKNIIVWDNNRGGWSYTDVERKLKMTPFGRSVANRSEVLGNEFENPALLKP